MSPITGEGLYSQWNDRIAVSSKNFCPFDPGCSDEIPETYDVRAIENKFPSLRRNPPTLSTIGGDLYRVEPARGVCEIILYSSKHEVALEDLCIPNIKKIINLWQERMSQLEKEPYVKYVFVFENRGKAIGVTISHSHGQIYAYPFIPPFVLKRLEESRKYFEEKRRCLYCEIIEREKAASPSRIVDENKSFIAFVPFWAKWAYEISIYPKRHFKSLEEIEEDEKEDLPCLKRFYRGTIIFSDSGYP